VRTRLNVNPYSYIFLILAEIFYKQKMGGEKEANAQMRIQVFWDVTMALEDEDARFLLNH
jgi:hypothetical protein